uniref:Uncharacterized protein n=1 Tax=Aegilops tauschii subsp. strangulata TaxID=200361 RepID=A0A453DC94_AEGTS
MLLDLIFSPKLINKEMIFLCCWVLQQLVKEGGRYVVVPGQPPMGCIPIVLTLYASPNKKHYDPGPGA